MMMEKKGFKLLCGSRPLLLLLLCAWSCNNFWTAAATEPVSDENNTGSGVDVVETEPPVCLDHLEGGDESSQPSCKSTTTTSSDTAGASTVISRWSEEKLADVFELWNFNTTTQQQALRQIGDSIRDVDHWKNDPYELSRFLKQFDMDQIKSEKIFRGMVQWRIDNEIDTLLQRKPENSPIMNMAPAFLMQHMDKEGDPIFIDRSGNFDLLGLTQQATQEEILGSFHFIMECISTRGGPDGNIHMPPQLDWQRNIYEKDNGGRRMTRMTVILDLDNLSWRQLRPVVFSTLQMTSRSGQLHYPGYPKRVIFIRAPKIFRKAWSFIQHFYDEESQKKFHMVTQDDHLEALKDYMDVEKALPPVIGGKGQPMPGFSEKVNMEGGRIDKSHHNFVLAETR